MLPSSAHRSHSRRPWRKSSLATARRRARGEGRHQDVGGTVSRAGRNDGRAISCSFTTASTALAADVGVLKTDVSILKTDVSGLKTDVSGLKTDVSQLKKDMLIVREGIGIILTKLG